MSETYIHESVIDGETMVKYSSLRRLGLEMAIAAWGPEASLDELISAAGKFVKFLAQ
jgi:hypothetical protein